MSSVKGLKELARNLKKLQTKLGAKALRSAAMQATTPVIKDMKQAAPKGKSFGKTYKGNIKGPGYLSRSIKRRSRIKNGKASIVIGVRKEAFYGLQFVEQGTKPHDIPKKKNASRRTWLKFNGRYVSSVKHPGARAKPWFKKTFIKNEKVMLSRFKRQLQRNIERLS